jgi:hypothetical protein
LLPDARLCLESLELPLAAVERLDGASPPKERE